MRKKELKRRNSYLERVVERQEKAVLTAEARAAEGVQNRVDALNHAMKSVLRENEQLRRYVTDLHIHQRRMLNQVPGINHLLALGDTPTPEHLDPEKRWFQGSHSRPSWVQRDDDH